MPPTNSKILMLYQDERLPSSRVRVLNLLPELETLGLCCTARRYPRKALEKLRLYGVLGQYDMVLLQKKLVSLPELFMLRRCCRKLAFDFDDVIHIRDDSSSGGFSRTRERRFANTIKNCDLVVAGNEVLAGYAGRFNPRVAVVPSAVPFAGLPLKDWRLQNETLVIGWVGGGGNLHHLSIIGDALRELARRTDLELRVIADQEFKLDGVRVRNIPWRLETQEAEIARFDVGIMPLPKNMWTEGKCSYKLLQYMAAGVPVVATDWGFNSTVVRHGENGFLADGPEEFCRYLDIIGGDRRLARDMGTAAREVVGREYSLAAVSAKLAAALKAAVGQRGSVTT